jgi:hypothetical protein
MLNLRLNRSTGGAGAVDALLDGPAFCAPFVPFSILGSVGRRRR